MTAPGPAEVFSFALRDGEFRRYLAHAGYYSGMQVVAVRPHTPWSCAEVLGSDFSYPMLLARQCDTAPHGWELRTIEGPPP